MQGYGYLGLSLFGCEHLTHLSLVLSYNADLAYLLMKGQVFFVNGFIKR